MDEMPRIVAPCVNRTILIQRKLYTFSIALCYLVTLFTDLRGASFRSKATQRRRSPLTGPSGTPSPAASAPPRRSLPPCAPAPYKFAPAPPPPPAIADPAPPPAPTAPPPPPDRLPPAAPPPRSLHTGRMRAAAAPLSQTAAPPPPVASPATKPTPESSTPPHRPETP